MSKRISDEEMLEYFEAQVPEGKRSELFDLLTIDYMTELLMAAEAQRKASDAEWVKWIDESGARFVSDEMEALEHGGFLEIDWSIWQSKRQKIENE